MRRRGFSLVESLVALAVLSLLAGLAISPTRRLEQGLTSQSLARQLLADFRAARERAIQMQEPTLIGFPSNSSQSWLASGYYVRYGRQLVRTVKLNNWQGQQAGSGVFLGHWPLDGGLMPQAGPIPTSTVADRYDLGQWGLANAQDRGFLFTPNGSLISNGLAVQSDYPLLICSGLEQQSAPIVGLSSALLTSVYQPWTLLLSADGGMRLEAGVSLGSQVAVSQQPLGLAGLAAEELTPSAPNADPTSLPVETSPLATYLDAGVSATVRSDGYLSLKVQAEDSDDDRLLCHWEASEGQFSFSRPTAMQWNQSSRKWESEWVWTPPPGALPGQTYTLRYRVEDGQGGQAQGQVGVNGVIEVIEKAQLIASYRGLDGSSTTYQVNLDGSDPQQLSPWSVQGRQFNCEFRAMSPDGNTICVSDFADYSLWIMDRFGQNLRRLPLPVNARNWHTSGFNPEGTHLIVPLDQAGQLGLAWVPVDPGGTPREVTVGVAISPEIWDLQVHPVTGSILFTPGDHTLPATQMPYLVNPDGTAHLLDRFTFRCNFSADGNTLGYSPGAHVAWCSYTEVAGVPTLGAVNDLGGGEHYSFSTSGDKLFGIRFLPPTWSRERCQIFEFSRTGVVPPRAVSAQGFWNVQYAP